MQYYSEIATRSKWTWLIRLALACCLSLLARQACAVRIKDLADLSGVRENPLIGYGIIVGLEGTGDKEFDLTSSSLKLVLSSQGITQKLAEMPTKNAAAVLVTAKLPPFARIGSKIDIHLSSIGTASSLSGGTLLAAALKGADGQVYAMAQGKVLMEKIGAFGGSKVTGSVPGGAILEKEIQMGWSSLKELRYNLRNPDFTTAARLAIRINEELSGRFAIAEDAGSVSLTIPYSYTGTPVDLIAQIETIEVESDRKAKVVVNPKTMTVVVGENVRVAPVAVAHGTLSIEVPKDSAGSRLATERGGVVTPDDLAVPDRAPAAGSAPLATATPATGEKPPAPDAGSKKKEEMVTHRVFQVDGVSVQQIVEGLNSMGASGEDLVGILRAMQSAGALSAELEVL